MKGEIPKLTLHLLMNKGGHDLRFMTLFSKISIKPEYYASHLYCLSRKRLIVTF